MREIIYRYGNDHNFDRVIELYYASTLGERRPVGERKMMAEILHHANLVVTAWDGELLVGIARTLTDFSYVGYLAYLAVRATYQRQGIGSELWRKTLEKVDRARCWDCSPRPRLPSTILKLAFQGMKAPGYSALTNAFANFSGPQELLPHAKLADLPIVRYIGEIVAASKWSIK